jgi:tetratricopeptide (TPR) repeat protein
MQHNLACTLRSLDRLSESVSLFRDILEIQQRTLNPDHPDTLQTQSWLGWVLKEQGELVEAHQHAAQALAAQRRVLGENHPGTLLSMNRLACVLMEQDRLVEAKALFEEVLEKAEKLLAGERGALGMLRRYYGECLVKLKQYDKAEKVLRTAKEELEGGKGIGEKEKLRKEAADLLNQVSQREN